MVFILNGSDGRMFDVAAYKPFVWFIDPRSCARKSKIIDTGVLTASAYFSQYKWMRFYVHYYHRVVLLVVFLVSRRRFVFEWKRKENGKNNMKCIHFSRAWRTLLTYNDKFIFVPRRPVIYPAAGRKPPPRTARTRIILLYSFDVGTPRFIIINIRISMRCAFFGSVL